MGVLIFLLRHLDLANNELHYLPDSMAQMTELGSLDLKLVLIHSSTGEGTWKCSKEKSGCMNILSIHGNKTKQVCNLLKLHSYDSKRSAKPEDIN